MQVENMPPACYGGQSVFVVSHFFTPLIITVLLLLHVEFLVQVASL